MSAIFLDFGNLGFQKLGFPVRKKHLMSVFKEVSYNFSTDISLQIAYLIQGLRLNQVGKLMKLKKFFLATNSCQSLLRRYLQPANNRRSLDEDSGC